MMMMKTAVIAIVAAVLIAATIADASRVTQYHRTGAPKGWKLISKAEADYRMTVTLALKQQNLDHLEAKFWSVSNPKSADYGRYMTREEVLELVAPEQQIRDKLVDWIRAGLDESDVTIKDFKDALMFNAPVAHIEHLFSTEIYSFQHEHSARYVLRQMGEYSIPKEVDDVIDMITGVADFPPQDPKAIRKANHNVDAGTPCFVPYYIKQQYNMSQDLIITNPSVTQAPYAQVASGQESGFGVAALQTWATLNGLTIAPISCKLGDGTQYYSTTPVDPEANLDIMMLTSIGNGATTCFWLMENWMYEFALHVFNTSDAPLVNSISYGWSDFAQCNGQVLQDHCSALGIPNSMTYIQRTDVEWQKLGVLGHTIIASSGDNGAPGVTNADCTNKLHPVAPQYPASSPYITAVGATTIVQATSAAAGASNDALPEICTKCACIQTPGSEVPCTLGNSGYTEGGGFAQYQPRPTYQDAQVEAWLAGSGKRPASNLFNSSNRAYPDIAALGNNIAVVDGGVTTVGGTSASCPIIAGMISHLNDLRLSQGKSSIGFFNQLLYQIAADVKGATNDITTLGNWCTESSCCTGLGYGSTTGWDPVTGFGTPNFGIIYDYVQNMQN